MTARDEEAAVANRFLLDAMGDLAAGALRPLAEYQARHPGFDDAIARHYHALALAADAAAATGGPRAGAAAAPERSSRPTPATLDEFLKGRAGSEASKIAEFARLVEEDAFATEPDATGLPSEGDDFGPYRIQGTIGRGGQGLVLLATDTRLPRPVALKLLHAHGAGSAHAFARFRREAELASKLDHPGICTVYETGTIRGVPFIAMRRLEGETLAQRYSRSRRERAAPCDRDAIAALLLLFEDAARALDAAHEAGVLHRDVKPGNIMVAPDGRPVILDFGLARDDGAGATLTLTGDALGTPAYMAPEQLGGAASARLDRRTDVWSLGVALFEGVCGRRPFEAATREGLYRAILAEPPPDPRRLNPAAGKDLAAVLETALAKERDRRYQSALALAEDLRRLRSNEPVSVRRAGPLLRVARWARREPAKATLALVLLVGLPVLAALVTARIKDAPRLEAQRLFELGIAKDERLAEGFDALMDLEYEDAARIFDDASRMEGGCPEAVAALARTLLIMRRPEPALEVLDRHAGVLAGRTPMVLRVEALKALDRHLEADALVAGIPEPSTCMDHLLWGMHLLSAPKSPQDLADATESIDLALALAPAPRKILYSEAVGSAVLRRDARAARRHATALVQHWPDSARAWLLRGRVLAMFDPAAGETAFREALRLDPGLVSGWIGLSGLLCKRGDAEGGMSAVRRALELEPDSATTRSALAYALARQNRISAAIAEYRRVIARAPSSRGSMLSLAHLLELERKYPEALELCGRALELAPADPVAHGTMGSVLFAQDDFGAAAESLRKSVDLDPRYALGWARLARALQAAGKKEDAAEACRRAVELQSQSAEVWVEIGRVLSRGKREESAAAFRKALELEKDCPQALFGLVRPLYDAGDVEGAIRNLRRCLELRPDDAASWNNLGFMLNGRSDFGGAADAYRRALAVDPEFPNAHCNLGLVYLRFGFLDDALASLRRGDELGSRRAGWKDPSKEWVAKCEAQLRPFEGFRPVLETLIAANGAPRVGDLPRLAAAARATGRPALAAAWYRDAFAADPPLAAGLAEPHLVEALRCAVALAMELGGDAQPLDDAARGEWLRTARSWFEAALAAWSDREDESAARRARVILERLASDAALSLVRLPAALDRLPESERAAWRALWERAADR